MRKQTTNNVYVVEDGTGRIEVKTWNDENEEVQAMKCSGLLENVYVQVIGQLKEFNNSKHVMAFDIKPVVDFNCLTHHYVECIYQHVQATKPQVQHTYAHIYVHNCIYTSKHVYQILHVSFQSTMCNNVIAFMYSINKAWFHSVAVSLMPRHQLLSGVCPITLQVTI